MTRTSKLGVLVLEDGTSFEGELFGADLSATPRADREYGEVVFNTSMTGYQEILTDPSYAGQMICFTTPHIGNTGINAADAESAKIWCGAILVHQFCEEPSNWRSETGLDQHLKRSGVPGLAQVDTRALTLHLRSRGVCRGVIVPLAEQEGALDLLRKLPSFEGRDLISEVTTPRAYDWNEPTSSELLVMAKSNAQEKVLNHKLKVVALELGAKTNLFRQLATLGCEIRVVPAQTTAQEILVLQPDGLFLSNGPGDPSAAPYAATTVRELLGKLPIFGVCMGHQILALALGAKTYKLKFGHRGGNHPVLDRTTTKVEISSHNHGYAVDEGTLPSNVRVTHTNLNDQCVEGIEIPELDAYSVQFHPEACPGPHDSLHLFSKFVDNLKCKHVSKISRTHH